MENKSLQQQFIDAKIPDIQDFSGSYHVKLISHFLPPIQFFGHKKCFQDNLSKERVGYNLFINWMRIGNYKLEIGTTTFGDDLDVLKIIYDHPGNLFFLRPLIDELREVEPSNYLGRGIYSIRRHQFNIFYFTLTR